MEYKNNTDSFSNIVFGVQTITDADGKNPTTENNTYQLKVRAFVLAVSLLIRKFFPGVRYTFKQWISPRA